ncbi:Aryl-alcohol dehydrogenase [Fulvia fulva]|uniref:Aryl-alcohol dehydrogenase n=1 Tax=Passalora fulva TaxID=5499 RepID=A0A9Q8PAL5_PASFU|nr:Aryl-alcohol dehydrogenase [Fulvia fulva]KAK4621648.1 Aryl-alcohol dehydrogenase [Fulvia fulva]KAK4622384.1 Aryl-alcohol dehydrogenase [Fulvia fulva]UJO18915.1 Aryl-alcohol dehydrogenase [Fulvia fulva]WPV16758.1 Aryl-alcohol dehydrogenase [Fulvia fulva]WPV31655.1 Aryl-alcohol dehydrogenase [Fulvia fulva]
MTTPTRTQAYVARPPKQEGQTNIQLEDVTYKPLGPTELLVEIAAASICHTDIKAAQGNFHMKPPFIIGHEAAGTVEAVGDKVSYVQCGDKVALSYSHCQKCRFCLTGRQAYCEEIFPLNFGGQRDNGSSVVQDTAEGTGSVKGLFFGQSSMSRLAIVRESCAVKLPPTTTKDDLTLFASLGCGHQTGAGAILNVARPPPGSRIVVFGAGAVGLSAIMAAKLSTPELLVLVDNSQTKLDMIAKEIVQDVAIVNCASLWNEGELATFIKDLTPDGRGVDFVVECTGNEAVNVEAHECLDKLGTLVNVGSSAGAKAGYEIGKQLVKGVTVRGTHQGDSVPRVMVPRMVEMWRAGRFPFDRLLTRYGFEDLDKALRDLGEGKIVKPVLVL